LGLLMMWLVFDTLGSKPAIELMRELFASNLRLLSELAQPWRDGRPADLRHLRALRDRISTNFASVNAQGDAVLFEIGPTRQRDLRMRDLLLSWQPRLRSIFLVEIALLQYRAQIQPAELASIIRSAQQHFDERASAALRDMADAFANRKRPSLQAPVTPAYLELGAAIRQAYGGHPPHRAHGVLAISQNLADLLDRLTAELAGDSPG